VLRLAFYLAGNAARRVDPQLAALYYRLMVERGHCNTQATVAVARKLVERTWTVLHRERPYRLRDLDGEPITTRAAKKLIGERFSVPEAVRARARAHSAATHRANSPANQAAAGPPPARLTPAARLINSPSSIAAQFLGDEEMSTCSARKGGRRRRRPPEDERR
jgi:hypothetical protein